MKVKFLIKVLICASVMYSCSSEQEVSQTQTESNSLITLLKEVADNNLEEQNYILFDISVNDKDVVSLSNKRIVEKTRHSEVYLNYQRKINGVLIQMPTQTKAAVQVCCTTDGEEYDCVICPDGAGQGLCILQALNACFDVGGCSVVCESKMYYNPAKKEFFILKN